ncbi:MAG: helicase-exonuclease AddAB subunit AddA [Candidatus Eisenbacteria sp.]|nr:helicase-exonuclease AddAB subunit AddA [Candidatus Eisenbacteria bacterium]
MPEHSPQLTDGQRRAVTETGGNLIVSSAAGAGKTTVLVGRFIHLVTEAEPRSEVDEILAVTFTDAAAQQLKSRIGEALRKKWRETGETRLARQVLLLDKAAISTIHGFCHEVVRQNFHHLGLDPEFAVMEEGEGDILRQDVLEDLFENLYDKPEDRLFREVVLRYGGWDLDAVLKKTVLRIHSQLQTFPDRDALKKVRGETVEESVLDLWRNGFGAYIRNRIEEYLDIAGRARGRIPTDAIGEPYRAYLGGLERTAGDWLAMLDGGEVESALAGIRACDPGRRPGIPKKDNTWGEGLGKAMDKVRNTLRDLRTEVAGRGWEQARAEIESLAPLASRILRLAEEFGKAYASAKASRALVDFDDLERRCLEILEEDSKGVARALRERFHHVLVDEYQDTNRVQERILSLVSRPPGGDAHPNLFTVGDVKQSIYRFRQAEPEVFHERYKRSSPEAEGDHRCIDLRENFRSRQGVIDAVNAVFEILMRDGESEILYDECARLVYAAGYPACPGGPASRDPLPVEVHLLPLKIARRSGEAEEPGEIEDWETAEREALFVARRIDELMGEGMQVRVHGSDEYRPLAYRDVVVLLRAPKHKAAVYMDVLQNRGIPVYTEAASGYLTATEIRDLVSLLRVIDNPLQDIPLAAVLRSPLVGLSEEDLVRVRLARRDDGFYHALAEYRDSGSNEDLREKIDGFLARLEIWRTLARRGPLADLVGRIFSETRYPAYVMGLDNGNRRRANLLQLHDRARQFDRFRTQGLRRFLTFIDRLLDAEGDFGQPPGAGEGEDAVRVMSIHKSKGLEFPVVFLPDLGKKFNLQDLTGDVLFDRDLGVACADVDPVRRERRSSVALQIVRDRMRGRSLAEELRILYVGMTRAKEHLILSGTVDPEQDPETWIAAAGRNPFGRARIPMDWVGSVLASQRGGCEALRGKAERAEVGPFVLHVYRPDDVRGWQVGHPGPEKESPLIDALARLEPLGMEPDENTSTVLDRLRWEYPWSRAADLPGKQSVTKIERRLNPWTEDVEEPDLLHRVFERGPSSVSSHEGSLSPGERGTAVHTILEHLSLAELPDEDGIRRQMEAMVENGLIPDKHVTALVRENIEQKIAAFFRSDLGRRMQASAETLRRELPFTMKIAASELAPDPEPCEDDFVVIQGVIDALFLEGDRYVLIDYKSDHIGTAEVGDRAREYEQQMAWYARAVRSILKKPVKAAYLYFLQPGEAVEVDVRSPKAGR